MASKSRGGAKVAKPEKDVGPPKAFIQSVKEATGASEEDVRQMLHDCNNDANEATNRLLDGAGTEHAIAHDCRAPIQAGQCAVKA